MVVRTLAAKPGWRVNTSLGTAIYEMEEQYLRRTNSATMRIHPTVVTASIPIEWFFSCCSCQAGDCCVHDGWLRIDPLDIGSPMLLREVREWEKVSQEEVIAWEVLEKMRGKKHLLFKFREMWFHRLPPAPPSTKEAPILMSPWAAARSRRKKSNV